MTSVRVLQRWIYGTNDPHEVGAIVECRDEDVAAAVASGLVEVVDRPEAEQTGEGEPLHVDLVSLLDQWELEMAPKEYLERYPQAKHAALARKIIEAQQGASPPVDEE
jgi:chromosome condensin MukBEF complex kleisin-like MukF subunit